ncbi:hypothetical protein GCM10027343_12950 [Noviherbaspirillum agri]
MSKSKRTAEEDKKQPQEYNSSPGDNSPSVTPKDVSADDASAKDVTTRKTCSDDPEEMEQELLDDAVEMTFPASDPIAIPSPESLAKRKSHRNPA